MSHMTKCATAIKNPNMQLLKETIEQIAREEGLTVTSTIHDYYKNPIKVDFGLTGPGLSRGIGFVVENGVLKTFGDPYGQSGYNHIAGRLVQEYTVKATARAVLALGYRSQVQQKQGDKIVLTVVAP